MNPNTFEGVCTLALCRAYYEQGYTPLQIAGEAGVSPSTVRRWLRRANASRRKHETASIDKKNG